MNIKKTAALLALAMSSVLVLAGCSSSSQSSDSANAVDIKNAILTNMSGDCADYAASYTANVKDVKRDEAFTSVFHVSEGLDTCTISSNVIPNYDFNDATGDFRNDASTQDISLTIPRNPQAASSPTEITQSMFNAVMLNGVVLDSYTAGCYSPNDSQADENGNVPIGCGPDAIWRLDAMGKVKFGTDSHNAHVQPGGLYHYHGNPNALFDPEETDQGSPVIGFAADGFPIYGPHYIDPTTGKMLEAKSGYTLIKGSRPSGDSSPGGLYDGTYIQDYEFTNAGTLDRCNGMSIKGQYGYYVSTGYPYVMGCYTGTPDQSFTRF